MNNPGREGMGRGRGRGVRRENQAMDRRDHRRPVDTSVVDRQFQEAASASVPAQRGAGAPLQPAPPSVEASNASDLCKTSKLSVNAKEFYPKGYVPNQDQNKPSGDAEESGAKWRLSELMTTLTRSPGEFDQALAPLKEKFSVWLRDSSTVHSIVDAIIEQSITETNFRYNGARLCSFLFQMSSSIPGSDFRTYLINRCNSLPTPTDPRRVHGLALFLAELFMQLEMEQGTGQRIHALGDQLFILLEGLVSQALSANAEAQKNPTRDAVSTAESQGENIKCVCQALKLAGWQLEESQRPRMTVLIKDLAKAAGGHAGERGVRRIATAVVDLRHMGWGRSNSALSEVIPSPSTVCRGVENQSQQHWHSGGRGRGNRGHYHSNLDEPVFYGPDGQILTAEESNFLQDSIAAICGEDECGDGEWGDNWSDGGMDEEMEAAFEQFLQLGQKSTTA